MTQFEDRGLDSDRPTPPVVPGAVAARREPPSWPVPIGVIAIVLGSLGALGGVSGVLSPLYVKFMRSAMPPGQAWAMDITERWMTYTVTAAAVSMILAIVLLIAGIGIVRRRRWSCGRVKTWACLKIVLVLFTAVMQGLIQRETFEGIQQQQPMMGGPASQSFVVGVAIGTTALALLWGWALPVFMLIWFSRRQIRNEVASWA